MQSQAEEITHCGQDEYSKWDVNKNGYVRNEVGKPMDDVMAYFKQEITKTGIDLEEYDYFQASKWERKTWPVLYRHIFVFAVPGGSEGHYVHVEVQHMNNTMENLVLGKTFMGLDHALELSNCISRILDWNYKM